MFAFITYFSLFLSLVFYLSNALNSRKFSGTWQESNSGSSKWYSRYTPYAYVGV